MKKVDFKIARVIGSHKGHKENWEGGVAINFSKIISLECQRKLVSSPVLGSLFDYVKSNPSVCLAFELCFT